MGYPNTSNFVKIAPLRVIFSTLFSLFGCPEETLSLLFDILVNSQFFHVVPGLKHSSLSGQTVTFFN